MDAKALHEKGKIAEEFIAKLCSNAFQQDFTFKNPVVMDKELCDVLIVLQNKVIIWQIKSLKEKDGEIKNKEVQKAIRQCTGAMRKMKSLHTITLKNVAEEDKIIDLSSINEYYLIVAIEDGIPDFHEFVVDEKENMINIFFSPFTRFALKYLNTVPDLLDYLAKKEKLLRGKNLIIGGGEENLLAYFLSNARSFGTLENPKLSSIYFSDDDLATKFEKREEVILRLKEENKYSPLTDFLIKKRRESISSNPKVIIPQVTRDLILSLFLTMNSLEKRMFGKLYQEAALKAYEISQIKTNPGVVATYRSYYLCKNVLYIFGFLGYDSQKEKEMRQATLQITAYGAVKKMDVEYDYIMCIATEIDHVRRKFPSFEWVFLDYRQKRKCNEHIDYLFPDLDKFLNELGILQDPTKHFFNQNEYEKSELIVDTDEDIQKYIEKYIDKK